jgi:hypothetical protein
MRRADDVMLHVCADACPAAGVRGRGYAMLPHEVRVPVARDGCDVDFTSSLGGRDDRCAPCTGYGAPDGGRRKSVIRPSYGIGSYVASLQTFSSRLSGRHRLSRVIRSLMLPWATRARSFAFGGVRGDLRVQSRRRLAPSLGRWLHTRNNHASRPAVLVVESPQGVETLAPHLEHLTFTSQ